MPALLHLKVRLEAARQDKRGKSTRLRTHLQTRQFSFKEETPAGRERGEKEAVPAAASTSLASAHFIVSTIALIPLTENDRFRQSVLGRGSGLLIIGAVASLCCTSDRLRRCCGTLVVLSDTMRWRSLRTTEPSCLSVRTGFCGAPSLFMKCSIAKETELRSFPNDREKRFCDLVKIPSSACDSCALLSLISFSPIVELRLRVNCWHLLLRREWREEVLDASDGNDDVAVATGTSSRTSVFFRVSDGGASSLPFAPFCISDDSSSSPL